MHQKQLLSVQPTLLELAQNDFLDIAFTLSTLSDLLASSQSCARKRQADCSPDQRSAHKTDTRDLWPEIFGRHFVLAFMQLTERSQLE